MTDLEQWQTGNERYLSAAMAWLRLRLGRLLPSTALSASPSGQEASSSTLVDRLLGRTPNEPANTVPALPTASIDASREAQLAQVEANLRAAEAIDPPPAALILSRRFGLSNFELEVLLLCAALELDTTVAALCARVQDNPSRPYPTFTLALALFDDPTWDALSPERPLRYWRLIEINQPNGQPLTASALRVDERVVNYLKGLNYLDDRLLPYMTASNEPDVDLPPSQQSAADRIVQQLSAASESAPIVQLVGPEVGSKQLVADRAAQTVGLQLYRLVADALPAQAVEIDNLTRLWERESTLLPILLYLDAQEVDAHDAQMTFRRLVTRCRTPLLIAVREVWPDLDRASVMLDIDRPAPAEQQQAWTTALPADGNGAARLAGQFNLNLPEIDRIARSVSTTVNGSTPFERAWDACLSRTRPRLDALAQRIDPRATWDLLVLADAETRTLKQIAAQVAQRSKVYDEWGFRQRMNRGLGISALFAGESGTGKTMAAEVIANELRLNLYRIDLSAVVSKYIGETEKNLRKLFDAAEDGGAILFFDEADALFGKRSEVKDSHDRYANIEINYLLQRVEAYHGLAILATNMKSALDQAFMRRLRFIVGFAFPGPNERKRIWQRVFPAETPRENLDFERLARFNLTGGSIHNVALNAAFLAAQADLSVTMSLIFDAIRAEFRKLERPINEAEFK